MLFLSLDTPQIEQVVSIALFALSIWIIALYADSKFRHFYDNRKAKDLAHNVTGIKRLVILRNQELKYIGLGLLWAGFSVGTVLTDGSYDTVSQAAYALGVLGLFIFMVSRIWPFLSE